MKLTQLTLVRCTEDDGRALLDKFLFRGMYGGPRVPRGIAPLVVSAFLRERVTAAVAPDTVARAAEVVRFYELADVVPHFEAMLTGREPDARASARSAYVLQVIADLGTPEQRTAAAAYFDKNLVPHPKASGDFPLLLETALALVPVGSADLLKQRIAAEVAKLGRNQNASEEAMMAYDRLAAVQRNDVPRTQVAIDAKRKLAAQPPADRRAELVLIYLLRHPAAGDYLPTWAARMLRCEALDVDAEPVATEFALAIDTAKPEKLGVPAAEFQVARAVQAIIYLQNKPAARHLEAYGKIENRPMSFLWDDLPNFVPARVP